MKYQYQSIRDAAKNSSSISSFRKWIFSACILLATSQLTRAAEDDWVHTTGSNNWFQASNWSLSTPPTTGDAAVVENSFASVQGAITATAQSLNIDDNGGVSIGGSSAGSLAVDGTISVGTQGSLILNGGSVSYNQLVIDAGSSYSDTFADTNILVGAGAGINVANGITATFNSQITGTDGLTKDGLGTVILANDNTYTGGTTNFAGTLQVGNGGPTGTLGGGDVNNIGTLSFDRSNTMTVTNNISGSGDVRQIGGGTTILTGNNSYSGPTLISAGTLQIGDGGPDGSLGTGNVTNISSLVFDRSDTITIDNLISGSGSVSFIGDGTNILTADNTYTGSTIINSNSAVQVGNGGPSGSLGSGEVINNGGPLVFDRSDDVTVGNYITGSGGLTQAGTGILTLTNNNDYTGETTINAGGSLQVGDGGFYGSVGTNNIHDNGTFIYDNNNAIFFNNTIDGIGSFVYAATNALALMGTNTYSGGTSVTNGGELFVGNSSALGTGDLNLQNGTLEFYDTLTNRITLNIGSFDQTTNGKLIMAVDGTGVGGFNQLHATNTATLNGTTLYVTGGYRPKHNDDLTLIIADGGIIGQFDVVSNDLVYSPLLNPMMVYGTTNVDYVFEQTSFTNFLATNNVALTRNQTAVAAAVDSIANSTQTNDYQLVEALDNLYSNLTNSLADLTNSLPKAFDQLSPDQLSSMSVAALSVMDMQGNAILKRVNELHSDYAALYESQWGGEVSPDMAASFTNYVNRQWNYYADAPVNFANVNGDQNASGYGITSIGLTVGADKRLNQQLYIGGTLGYVHSSAGLNNGGSMEMHTFDADIYATWFNEFGFHLEAMAGGEINIYDTERGTFGGTADGNSTGTGWTGLLGGGYDWDSSDWKFGPQASIQYMSSDVSSFTEKGSFEPLHVNSQSIDAMHSQVGFNARYRYLTGRWTYINPEAYFGWRHDFLDSSLPITSQFASGSGSPFTVYSPELGRDSIVLSLGVSVQWNPELNTYINFTAQTGRSGYDAENIDLGVRWSF